MAASLRAGGLVVGWRGGQVVPVDIQGSAGYCVPIPAKRRVGAGAEWYAGGASVGGGGLVGDRVGAEPASAGTAPASMVSEAATTRTGTPKRSAFLALCMFMALCMFVT